MNVNLMTVEELLQAAALGQIEDFNPKYANKILGVLARSEIDLKTVTGVKGVDARGDEFPSYKKVGK